MVVETDVQNGAQISVSCKKKRVKFIVELMIRKQESVVLKIKSAPYLLR